MKVTKQKRSVVPVYLIALTWLIATFLFGVKTVTGYGVTAAVSVLAFFVGRLLFPDQVWEEEAPQPAPEPEDPEVAALQKERERAVSELRRLNENIADEEISARLSHMEAAADRIFDHVLAHPEKRSVVRRFMDYYLPTTIKLLNQYDRMDQLGMGGENITAAKDKIRAMLETVSAAFDKQFDSLFRDEYMDISAEITVLEQMMQQEGLTGGIQPSGQL